MEITSPVVKSFVAGCCSGTCSTFLFQPLDLVKTRIQLPITPCGSTGMLSVANTVIRQEKNVLALWKGLVPSLSRCVPGVGIYFSSIHFLQSKFESDQKHAIKSILIGAAARTIAVVTVIPFTVLKTRFESGVFDYGSMRKGLYCIYRAEGVRAMYSGMAPTLVRDVPFSGLYLMFYTKLKEAVNERVLDRTHVPELYFTCKLAAGSMAALITQPADVVKTHMQMDSKTFNEISKTIMYIYKKNGYAGFFRGIIPRTLRRTLMAAMSWTVYEMVSQQVGLK